MIHSGRQRDSLRLSTRTAISAMIGIRPIAAYSQIRRL